MSTEKKHSGAVQPPDMPLPGIPEKTRALNVIVPASVHRQVRVAAAKSEMSVKDFVAKVLDNVKPFPLGKRP